VTRLKTEHPVCAQYLYIYIYTYIRIRALKVFLVFRGAWVAVARRLRGWFRAPVSVRVGYGGGERVRYGWLCRSYDRAVGRRRRRWRSRLRWRRCGRGGGSGVLARARVEPSTGVRARCSVPLRRGAIEWSVPRDAIDRRADAAHPHSHTRARLKTYTQTLRMTLYNVRWDDARAHTHTDGIGEHSHARPTKAHGSQCLLQSSTKPPPPPPLAKNKF